MAKNLKQLFLGTVGTLLPDGHRYVKARAAFCWDRNDHSEIFGVRILDRTRKVELAVGLSFPRVEAIFNECWPIAPEFRKGSYTIAAQIRDLNPDTPTMHAPLDEQEFEICASRIATAFDRYAIAYFRANSSLEAVDGLLNQLPEENSVHCSRPYRGAIGIIVASMVGRPDLPALVSRHRAVVATLERGFYLPNFDRIVGAVLPRRRGEG